MAAGTLKLGMACLAAWPRTFSRYVARQKRPGEAFATATVIPKHGHFEGGLGPRFVWPVRLGTYVRVMYLGR